MLDADCILVADTEDPRCFDDGFPAISADGVLIATMFYPPMGQNDVFAIELHILDVKTSRVVREERLLDETESFTIIYPAEAGPEATPRLHTTVSARTAKMQRFLDAKRFRSMTSIEASSLPASVRWRDHAELAGSAESDCGAWEVRARELWWDPATRNVLAQTSYITGGCIFPTSSSRRFNGSTRPASARMKRCTRDNARLSFQPTGRLVSRSWWRCRD